GGTGPFTAELYNVSGSAQVGSNVIISSPGGSNTISFPASTTGTFSYNAIVTDLGTFLPYVFNSVSNTIILNPALATPTAPVLSGNNIDYTGNPIGNQNIDANTLVTGGTSPYTYNFITSYASNDVVFSYTPQASNSLSDSTLQTAPPGNYVMNVIVTDSANTPVSANSLYTSNILVSVAPTISSLAASNTTLDAGQVEVYTFNVYNGIGPFTAELYNSTAGKLQGSNVLINSPGGSNTISFITSNTGTFSYEIFATDEGSDAISPYAVSSITNSITVKKTPTITLTATSSTSLTLGGTVTFLASVPSGGAGPFTVTLHGATCVSGVFMNTITTSGSNALLSCDPQSTGSYNIYVSAVDTGTTTHYNLVNSGTVAVAVSSSGGGGGGGGGGSGGGGGGGTQKPVIVNITNGFNVTGIAQLNTFNVTLCGGKFFFTDNFISPNDTGMSVNGKNYTMYVNKPIVLLSTPTQTCYMDLQNVSYLPVLHTVQLMVYVKSNGVVHTVIITEQNFIGVLNGTFAISGNSSDKLNFKPANVTVLISLGVNKTITPNYTIENVTANTPALANATKLVAIRLNISNSTVILFFTMHYPCGMNVSRINAYKLINGAWTSVTSTTNASACADTFTLTGGDPTVGLFEAALPAATSSTTSASTTVSTTSVSGVQLPPAPDYTGTIIAIIVIVVVVVAIVLYYRSVAMKRKRMPGGGSRR
ncbi:MAG: hypothetical protein LVQ95_04925, partial [Candidatus Micrarchaeales archaeon]|nr:hypothetical protein [Candidatus Micrarchaeales archaeon]